MRKQIKIEKSEYSKVIERRDRWLLVLDRYLEHPQIKKGLNQSTLSYLSKKCPDDMSLKTYRDLKQWHKRKFQKYKFILEELKELEKTDHFGFRKVKSRTKKANPYSIKPATLKSLLENVRKDYS